MISFEEAGRRMTTDLPLSAAEKVKLDVAVGRVLAESVMSDIDMPPFDKAAVDGYACRREDLGMPLRMTEVIPAGIKPKKAIGIGECAKIMTGAMLPTGADCVVMVENTSLSDDIVIIHDIRTKNNIAYQAEEIKKGSLVLGAGTLIKPQHIAVLAAVGVSSPTVYTKVTMTIFSTGDELVEPHLQPTDGKIRNSNSSQLLAQSILMGVQAKYGGIIPDDEKATRQMIGNALIDSQVIMLSGGISMGDFDYVPAILTEMGFEIQFRSVAVQPGKPTVFARSKDKFVIALPGNPVSSLNIFELLAKPFLYQMMGHSYRPLILKAPLGNDFTRKTTDRYGFVPGFIDENGTVWPVHYQGSAHIHALTAANVLISFKPGTTGAMKGEFVDVRFI